MLHDFTDGEACRRCGVSKKAAQSSSAVEYGWRHCADAEPIRALETLRRRVAAAPAEKIEGAPAADSAEAVISTEEWGWFVQVARIAFDVFGNVGPSPPYLRRKGDIAGNALDLWAEPWDVRKYDGKLRQKPKGVSARLPRVIRVYTGKIVQFDEYITVTSDVGPWNRIVREMMEAVVRSIEKRGGRGRLSPRPAVPAIQELARTMSARRREELMRARKVVEEVGIAGRYD